MTDTASLPNILRDAPHDLAQHNVQWTDTLPGFYESGAVYSKDMLHRYVLWRLWEPRTTVMRVIACNPSTATESVADPTNVRLINFAKTWGFGGLIMLNIFSVRSTKPQLLYDLIKYNTPDEATGDPDNLRYVLYFCRARPDHRLIPPVNTSPFVLAAWGEHGALIKRGATVAAELVKAGTKLHALAVNRSGQPKHPLYCSSASVPQPYLFEVR